eukprot:TRINITY_DN665_c0_g1_i4.p1 TRINITY_DN665_c0_g1~~TRINITY_DN665_c0_g1_i4.p1  ORF type:complete len:249 (-),score=40.65 TRINITY_DN665_c0_g1_i4:321-1067(-)
MAEKAEVLNEVLEEDGKNTDEGSHVSVVVVPKSQAVPYGSEKDFLLMCSLKAPFYEVQSRAPVSLVCVIDQSSSMSGDRLRLVKNSLKFIIQNLSKQDSLSIVVYDTQCNTAMGFTVMDSKGKAKANKIADNIRARGRTNLVGGLIRAIEEFEKEASSGEVRSIMLFTDGQANVGYTTPMDVVRATVDTKFAAMGPTDRTNSRPRASKSGKEKPTAELKSALEDLQKKCRAFFRRRKLQRGRKTATED